MVSMEGNHSPSCVHFNEICTLRFADLFVLQRHTFLAGLAQESWRVGPAAAMFKPQVGSYALSPLFCTG